MKERQELYCHECENYVQFDIDTGLEGNHILKCPVCGHEHCRVVEKGEITDIRWDSRNPTFTVSTSTVTYSSNSTYDNYTSSQTDNSGTDTSYFLYNAWSNTGS